MKQWNVYLSGEIHSDWREQIKKQVSSQNLPIVFTSPVTDHELSDDCGAKILGSENDKFWHDHKGAKINTIRSKTAIKNADIVIVRFGDKYKQWNAAFDAGYATALSKPLVIIHQDEHQHALKEIDAVALAVTKNVEEVSKILQYTIEGKI